MLMVVIYRDIQRVNCSYKTLCAVVFAINERLNAMPRKGVRKYVGSKQHCRIS